MECQCSHLNQRIWQPDIETIRFTDHLVRILANRFGKFLRTVVKLLKKRWWWWIPVGARLEGPKLEPEGPTAEVQFPTADQGFSSIQGSLFGFHGI